MPFAKKYTIFDNLEIPVGIHPDWPSLSILRLDALDPVTGGNKLFKLKYNLQSASAKGVNTILTFGGVNSNHILATAAICVRMGFKAIGLIRGEKKDTDTIRSAQEQGMRIEYLTREEYRRKSDPDFIDSLSAKYGDFHLVPEGGFNCDGIKGCSEILPKGNVYDFVICACGSGAMYAGMLLSSSNTIMVGISV